jgi:hypothetical protein
VHETAQIVKELAFAADSVANPMTADYDFGYEVLAAGRGVSRLVSRSEVNRRWNRPWTDPARSREGGQRAPAFFSSSSA